MTERTVTIKIGTEGGDAVASILAKLIKQRNSLQSKSTINLKVNADGIEQARKASEQVRTQSAGAIKDLGALGDAITSKAVAPWAQYQKLMGAALQASRAMGTGTVSALRAVSVEFDRQRTLALFWGTSGYIAIGLQSFKNNMGGFLASSGSGFTNWLKDASANLTQYRTALATSAAVLVGFAAAAGLSSKHAQNYITSTLDSRLMERKLTDKAGAAAWVESAQKTDWSAGRESRMGTFQTVLSKNQYMGQKSAQKATEDIEKFFFANQEMLKKKGYESTEQLASAVSAPVLSSEDASKFEDIFGLGFSTLTPQARLGRISTAAPNDEELKKAEAARPNEILTKRLTATTASIGDAVLPVLNQVLGAFLDISDAIGKIPGLGPIIGWGVVLAGAASAGLIVVSMIGSMIPGLQLMYGLLKADTVARYANIAAQYALATATAAGKGTMLAATGATAALSAIYGVLTGSITLSTLATWGLNAAMGALAAIEGIVFSPIIVPLLLIAGLIGIVAYKTGLLSAILKGLAAIKLGDIFGDLSKGDFGKAWKDLTKGFKLPSLSQMWGNLTSGLPDVGKLFGNIKLPDMKGVLKIGLDALIASSPLLKTILIIVDYLKKLWQAGISLNKIFGLGLTLWENLGKLGNFFRDILQAIIDLPGKLYDLIWGKHAHDTQNALNAQKEEDEKKLGNQIGSDKNAPGKDAPVDEKKAYAVKKARELYPSKIAYSDEDLQGVVNDIMDYLGAQGGQDEQHYKDKLNTRYPILPTEPVDVSTKTETGAKIAAQATNNYNQALVKTGSQTAAVHAMYNPVEVYSAAIGGFINWLAGNGESDQASATDENAATAPKSLTVDDLQDDNLYKNKLSGNQEYGKNIKAFLATGETKIENWASLAKGGQIKATGSLIGHGGEEVSPADVTVGGKTTLEKINDIFSGGSISGQGGQPISISSPITVNVAKMDGKADVKALVAQLGEEFDDKLLFRIRNKLDNTSTRSIAYMRG